MNILNTKAGAVGAGVLVGGLVLYWIATRVASKASDTAAAVGAAVNPASDQNLAYRGVNAIGSAITGDPSWSLGSWLYDVFNPPPEAVRSDYAPRKLQVRQESIVADWLVDHG